MQEEQKGDTGTTPESPAELLAHNLQLMEQTLGQIADHYKPNDHDQFNLMQASASWLEAISKNPDKMMEAGMRYWQDAFNLYHQNALTLMGLG